MSDHAENAANAVNKLITDTEKDVTSIFEAFSLQAISNLERDILELKQTVLQRIERLEQQIMQIKQIATKVYDKDQETRKAETP